MGDIPLVPLSFIAGPAILANACAIMQNGASIRYNLAVQHLREFRTWIAAQETKRTILYDDPRKAGACRKLACWSSCVNWSCSWP